MDGEKRTGKFRWAWIVYLLLVHGLAAAFLLERFVAPRFRFTEIAETAVVSDPTISTPVPSPPDVPTEFYDDANQNTNVSPQQPALSQQPPPSDAGNSLLIPVAGVKAEQLTDTFTASRSSGRVHNAIDIMAPQGTPVLAATDGKILKFHDSVPGGITIYQLSADNKYILYYAHLQKRADMLKEGDVVRRGAIIGYVGDTGNSGAGNFHLHFALWPATDPKRFWEGENINPYPLLRP